MSIQTPEIPVVEKESLAAPPKSIDAALHDTFTMLESRGLPIMAPENRNRIEAAIRDKDLLIIEAGTGTGKTTAVPIMALEEIQERNPGGRIVVTQPRRFAVEKLYSDLSETMGDKVGFKHGRDSSINVDPQLTLMIDKSLLNEMVKGSQADPLLLKYDAVVLDEIHERNADMDILMALLKQAQKKRAQMGNPLKIILTSATLDREKLIRYFEGATHIEAPGKIHPVEEHFEGKAVDEEEMPARAAQRAAEIIAKGIPGEMLIFMPGRNEIQNTVDELAKHAGITAADIEIIPLIGGDEGEDNIEKTKPNYPKRRIFVATNVAETSVTIPSIRIIIDSGLMKMSVFNPQSGITGLELLEHTKSNAKQRRGRAGRNAPGYAHYLYTEDQLERREDHLPAEILRIDLASQVLEMKDMGIQDIHGFDFIDHPGKEKIDKAIQTLQRLGAVDKAGDLTEIGRRMARLDTDPQFARMIVEAQDLGVEEPVALIASMMQNAQSDVFDRKFRTDIPMQEKYAHFIVPGSDVLTRLKVWNEYVKHISTKEERMAWGTENGIRTNPIKDAAYASRKILRGKRLTEPFDITPELSEKITQAVAAGLIDNILQKSVNGYTTLSGTTGIRIDRKTSVLGGSMPKTIVSGNIRKNPRGEMYAGFNLEVNLQKLKEELPYLEEALSPAKEAPKTEVAKDVEAVKEEIKQVSETVAQPVHIEEVKPKEPEKPIPVLKAEERKNVIRRVQEALQSYQKKFPIINGKSPEAWEDFKTLLRRLKFW